MRREDLEEEEEEEEEAPFKGPLSTFDEDQVPLQRRRRAELGKI